jgi:hypothetical protein
MPRVLILISVFALASTVRADAPDFFPICVWLQSANAAAKYKAIGVNTYVGLWNGPTESQLAALEKLDVKVVCAPRMTFKDRKSIIAWMHGDEPDNAQPLPKGARGYGPPIAPEKIVADYQKIKADDPARPVLLNLGQGVAYDNYIGRGVRRNKMEDYPKYIEGCDIASFDIYPVTNDAKEVAGNLWYVPRGVERLRAWAGDQRAVWNCIETTRISNEKTKPTPRQVKAEVWMSIIHGSRGLIYFAHQFKPKFIEAGLLADEEMSKAVGEINSQVRSLAPAINAPTDPSLATVTPANPDAPIALMCKKRDEAVYLFAVAMRDTKTTARFTLPSQSAGRVEVVGEQRTLDVSNGAFEDAFDGYAVHLYRVPTR